MCKDEGSGGVKLISDEHEDNRDLPLGDEKEVTKTKLQETQCINSKSNSMF